MQNSNITKFQGALGVIVMVAAGIWAWCHMTGLNSVESPVRAQTEAGNLAQAVIDFRVDMGHWPTGADGKPDMAPLLGRRAALQVTNLASSGGAGMNGMGGLADKGGQANKGHLGREQSWVREIPLDPWGGSYRIFLADSKVAILSLGPDGRLDTDATRLWARPENINPADGDDICVVLDLEKDGGS